jgi:Family of unknown function (DUF6084)
VSATSLALAFRVEGAEPLEFAAVPTLRFALGIESAGPEPIRSLLLDVQLQIAARRRSYQAQEQAGLLDLFGEPERWSTTLRTLPWTRTTLLVPGFESETRVALDVPCTYDFEVAATRYLLGLEHGEVPLELLFSGTVFYAGEGVGLQAMRIDWRSEAEYRLPVSVWRATMDGHFPGTTWLRLSRESFERLSAFRQRRALLSWEDTLAALLDEGPP